MIETLDYVAKLDTVAALQARRLQEMLAMCAQRHPFYRERIRSLERDGRFEWSRLSTTSKSDLSSAPMSFVLEDTDDDPEYFPWDTMYTSGSTAKPVPIVQRAFDYRALMFTHSRIARIRGITSDDTIANLFPLTARPHGAFYRCNDAAIAVGARLVAGLGGRVDDTFNIARRTSAILHLLEKARPTVLWGVPSYIVKMLRKAQAEKISLPDVRLICTSGEPLSTTVRERIQSMTHAVCGEPIAISNSFGASELQFGLVECANGGDFHNPVPELLMLEVVDSAGVTVPDGTEGHLTITHLVRRGTVLLKYLTGDRVTFERSPCPDCGCSWGRITQHGGRTDSMVKVRGQLFDTNVLERLLRTKTDILDYQIRLFGEDGSGALSHLEIVLEPIRAGSEGLPDIRLFAQEVKQLVGVEPIIIWGHIEQQSHGIKESRVRVNGN
jgi:phenylacetate-CoA ligase